MLYDNLASVAARVPGSSGLRQNGVLHSYAEIVERSGRLGSGLMSRGLGEGDAVGILVPNGPDLFRIVYGLLAIGAVAVPLNLAAPHRELAASCRKAGIAAIIARVESEQLARDLVADLGNLGRVPLFLLGGEGDSDIAALEKSPLGRLPALGPDAPAIYLFSSGSTGLPKVVPHTHGEMLANARATVDSFALTPDDVAFNNLPGHHAMGFLNSVFETSCAGATTVYWSDPMPLALSRRKLLGAVEAEKVTVLQGVPFMFDTLAGVTDEIDLSRLRLVYSAGIALKRPIYDHFRERFGHSVRQAYGCTEAGHVAFNTATDPEATWDSVGQPIGDTRVEVVPSDNPLGPEYGELTFSSSSVTKGYLNQEKLNTTAFPEGRFQSGDLGRIDAEGNVYIKGRSKLIIEVAGHKVDPLEIEEVLVGHPAVAEVVVVGLPNARTGEQRLKAVVVKSGDVTADVLLRFGKERLSPQKVPEIIEFRDAIPKSATGKILRGKLIED